MLNILKHLFIPHERNNHRAKILHLDSLLLFISLVFFLLSILSPIQHRYPSVLGISSSITPLQLLDLTNQVREQHNLNPLSLNPQLSHAASYKASDMFNKNYWSHFAPDGITPWFFILNSGYEYLYAGENLARGFTSSSEVVDAWMKSPSHRDNMLSPNYKDVGFAIAEGELTGSDTILVVEMLGTKYNSQIPNIPNNASQSSIITISQKKQDTPLQQDVAAISQNPIINRNNLTNTIIFTIISILIISLAIDAFIMERRKIARALSHNFDHILYLIIIFATILIITKGAII